MSDQHEAPLPPAAAPVPAATAFTTANVQGTRQHRGGFTRGHSRGRGGRGRGGGGDSRRKRKNMGRNEYNRAKDKNHHAKRMKIGDGDQTTEDNNENRVGEIDGGETGGEEKEARKPKRKVAVMLSYCGSGYKGMQLNPPHKSIEGDLFEAFVKAGAISQANSNDPKKSSLVRCARTDKGVHAAGNVISLKLIVEDPELIQKINTNLPEQIRVWDVIRTTGSFSSYQICDSRKYEYLLPSHVFLPPHPKSYLAKKCREHAEKEGDLENYLVRQKEVEGWWEQTNTRVNNILEQEGWYKGKEDRTAIDKALEEVSESEDPWKEEKEVKKAGGNQEEPVLRRIREIHAQEKRAYHISSERLDRVRTAFQQYVGTNNFYNFTVDKTFKDPSAKRHIKSFEVNDPITIDGAEWLSIHVHGQSFMMHQIRKMVGLVMMVVRTGCPISRIQEAFGPRKIAIGKAPSLGLLLEYPLFSHYNEKTSKEHGRDPLDFEKYKEDIDKFKEKFIYSRIFEEEEKQNTFTQFVQYLDTYKSSTYLYLTSAGLTVLESNSEGAKNIPAKEAPGDESDDDVAGDG